MIVRYVISYDGIRRAVRFNNAFKAGWLASRDAEPESENPYNKADVGSRAYRNAWAAGYEWAQAHPEASPSV